PALRPRVGTRNRSRRDQMAVGCAPADRQAGDRHAAQDRGAPMRTSQSMALPSARAVTRPRFAFSLANRLVPPIFITCILIAAHLSFGVLESYTRTALAIVTAIAAELLMGLLTYGQWPHPASAYITGISVGILVRSPFFWPYALASLISITSKY